MDEATKLKRDIDTLKESMRLGWHELATANHSADERRGLIKSIKWCALQLNMLLIALEHGVDDA